MPAVKMFVDTHDVKNNTFPGGISEGEFSGFLAKYVETCEAEGVVLLDVKTNLTQGRAFCITLAQDRADVERVHQLVGLSFDDITEVRSASPGSLFWQPNA